jgi:acyl-lipid omega-6 desaturase (Delta-12 desaturase)
VRLAPITKKVPQQDWAAITRRYEADDARGFVQVLTTLGALAALWFVVAEGGEVLSWLTLGALLPMALFLLRAFVLMHECGHGSLFRTAALNRAFGFVFGVVAGMPQFVWAKHHAYHHATNGNWEKYRGPLNTRSVDEFRAMTPGQQRQYELGRRIWMAPIGGLLYLIVNPRLTWVTGSLGLLGYMLKGLAAQPGVPLRTHFAGYKTPCWNDAREYWHMFWNNVALLAGWVLMSLWLGPVLFFLVYVVSVSLAGGAAILIFTVQHNFEHSYASDTADWDGDEAGMSGTSFLDLPRWLHWFTANIAYHHIHHAAARIPNYRLAECHDEHRGLFDGVKRIKLFQVNAALKYILWDVRSRRIISVAEFRQLG